MPVRVPIYVPPLPMARVAPVPNVEEVALDDDELVAPTMTSTKQHNTEEIDLDL